MADRLMLIGWDAADWKVLHPLMDKGEMPTLNRLVENGASGELLTVQPALPAALWTTILTGKRAWQHDVCHSQEMVSGNQKMASITAARRRSVVLWEMLAHQGKRSLVIGWPATHGGRPVNSMMVSDRYPEPTAGPGIKPWPAAVPGTYWPADYGPLLDPKRVSPEDIGANVISQYIPAWRKIDQKRDHRLGQLRLFLAADYSYQTAALKLVKEETWDFAAIRFPALAPISRLFLPHHLAQSDKAGDEFEIYRTVVQATCRILDEMLRQLIELAGPNTAVMVVSEHGVRTKNVPPRGFPPSDEESWKSPYGILAACGPKFAPDALVHGAGVLDIAPTVLTWFGLPIGDDMEGRVLMESFETTPEVTRVASWDLWMGISPSPGSAESEPSDNKAVVKWRHELDWNFVQSCLEASRYEAALPVLHRLFSEFPERAELGHALFHCQISLKQTKDAAETMEVVLEGLPPSGVFALLTQAELAVAQGNSSLARSLAGQAQRLNPGHPMALRKLGLLLLRLREWDSLARVAQQALAMDEQEPIAWLGLAVAQLRKGNAVEAVDAASRAIGLKFFLPDAHFVLARGLVAQGRWQEAKEAMQTLLKLQPNNRVAATYFKRMPATGAPP